MRACPSLHVRTYFSSMDHFSVFVELSATCTFSSIWSITHLLSQAWNSSGECKRIGRFYLCLSCWLHCRGCYVLPCFTNVFRHSAFDLYFYDSGIILGHKRDMFLSIDSQLRSIMYGFLEPYSCTFLWYWSALPCFKLANRWVSNLSCLCSYAAFFF